MSWVYKDKVFDKKDIDKNIGFVYLIENLTNKKKYIGQKKFFTVTTRPPLKNKIRKRKLKKFSDWEDYYGSNEELKADVVSLGKSNFHREILFLCERKSQMNYIETKLIFLYDAILDDGYYNTWVSCKINRNQLEKMEKF